MRIWPHLLAVLPLFLGSSQAQQQPATTQAMPGGGMLSRFAADMDPANPLPEYPRPQMVRPAWTNLNGRWDYAITPADAAEPPGQYEGRIVVPFAIESALSGVQKPLRPDQRLWYRRSFPKPPDLDGRRLLLHFGAVDWEAEVFVNGRTIGRHEGGYDPFSFDITQALRDGDNELVVAVRDPTTDGQQPVGKQRLKPEGIWYTPVSGIWQTVWLEPVPNTFLRELRIEPDVDGGVLRVSAGLGGTVAPGFSLKVDVSDGAEPVASGIVPIGGERATVELAIPDPKLWSPQSPHLYDLRLVLLREERPVDEVLSYAGMRKISLSNPADGPVRILLNNEPVFMLGLLDQGWWPDGLYTAPTDDALRYDIEVTKDLGFNLARKHVKIEPARWYYWADKAGLIVWQDFPASFAVNVGPDSASDPEMPEEARDTWRREYRAMIDNLGNHPCIVAWIPFNEGWGQHDTNHVIQWTKKYDPTRLVGGPSGWTDRGMGDFHDMHSYPGPSMFEAKAGDGPPRASVLGEFGGLGLPLEGHLWQPDKNWGYRTFKTQEELADRYGQLMLELHPLIRQGLAAAVYTQTTDVEGEVNGLMTYDRRVLKIDQERLRQWHAPLYKPVAPADRVILLPTSEEQPQAWLYVTEAPQEGWPAAEFDDGAWKNGFGGFGTEETPGARVRTEWNGKDIWLRRSFDLKEAPAAEIYLRIHHDEDAEIYLNGQKVRDVRGYSTGYRDIPLPPEASTILKKGQNVIAIHCRQTDGGQYIDAGLVELRPTSRPATREQER